MAYCTEMGIAYEAWSPLGGDGGKLLDDAVLKKSPKNTGNLWPR